MKKREVKTLLLNSSKYNDSNKAIFYIYIIAYDDK